MASTGFDIQQNFVHVGVHPIFGRDKQEGAKKKKKIN